MTRLSKNLFAIALLACGLFHGAALARNADGTLGLIVAPNSGVTVIVTPGASFEAQLSAKAELSLEGPATLALQTTWDVARAPRAVCTVPANAPEGVYALTARTAGGADTNARAVYVRKDVPEVYAVAHISDTHLGSKRHARSADDIVREVFASVNASGAAFALVTGDVTDNAEPDQYRAFLALLDTCALPTFVVPGNHDRGGRTYESFFGPPAYRFRFGQDGYIGFDTRDFFTADDWGPQPGQLEQYRRELKAVRWAIGFTHRFEPAMGMRAQLSLFADNPLDFLFFGHWHRENNAEETVVPWGTTKMIVTPAAIDGVYRMIDITAQGPIPRPVQQAAKTGDKGDK